MSKSSLAFKVGCGYFFIILSFLCLIFLFSFITIRHHYLQALTKQLENTGAGLQWAVAPLLDRGRSDALDALVRDTGKEADLRITVIDIRGVVLADSLEDPRKMENHATRPEVVEARSGKIGHATRFSSTENKEMMYVALPLRHGGHVIGVLRLSLFLTQTERFLSNLKYDLLKVTFVITLVSLIAAFLFSSSVSRPIKELAALARRIGSGDFGARVFLKRSDELGSLARTLNDMAEQLGNSYTHLSRESEELNAIIYSLNEGLVVLDRTGTILRCNKSFEALADTECVSGKLYWEIFRNADFSQLLERVRRERQGTSGEMELADKTYVCNFTFLESGEKVVTIFHDITEIKKLGQIKKDFVVNVSHELRTPLTAIKGFIETMDSEVTPQGKHYLTIITRNTDRLIHIVTDLLLLSELEQKEELHLRKINLAVLVRDVLPIFEQRLKEKGLTVSLEAPEKLPPVHGDAFKLEQVFVNLIDNAVKYTENGTITLSLQPTDGRITVQVRDTGIGIPKQDLPRIFERFYVVDKSRSRKFGGTGLGLSIVKHIVLLHNGAIDIQSTEGVGTSVTFTLPAGHQKRAEAICG